MRALGGQSSCPSVGSCRRCPLSGRSSGRYPLVVSAAPPRINTKDYSASDQPQRRKNPELYNLTVAPDAPGLAEQYAHRHKPEVLSPAGGWPELRAAVESGADAVYFGVEEFNARRR